MIRKLSAILIFCLFSCASVNERHLEEAVSNGEMLFQEKRYSEAMTVCSEAEQMARQLDDQFCLGKIYRIMAHISNAAYRYQDEIQYLKMASDAFHNAEKPYNRLYVDMEKGMAYYNVSDYASAEKVYRDVLYRAYEVSDTALQAQCLSAYAALSLEVSRPDPSLAIDMLSRVANDLKYPLSSADRGVLAYAYSLSGNDDEALKWAEKALSTAQSPSEKAQADFRLYQIRSRMGDDSHALRSLEAVMEYSNSVEMASLMKSVASSRKDFLDQQHMATQHRLRSTRLTAAFILLSLMSVVFAMLGYIRYKRLEAAKILAEEKAETEKYMNIAEDLQAKLKTASKRLPSEKHMSIAKFDVLERLCEQYYVYEGTPNLQDKVLKEVKSVIQGLRDDPKMLKGLELMLDRNCNEIVRRLREQLPKLKEDDIRLFVFAASGFSSTTISTILEKDKGIVYNRIWRLKGKISSSEASDKDDFLASLNT